jgi:putative glycosyltransferase (TIGR04372 family)
VEAGGATTRRDAVIDDLRAARLHNRFDEVIRGYRTYLEREPACAKVWYLLGASLQATGDLEGARSCFSAAFAHAPYYLTCSSRKMDLDIFSSADDLRIPDAEDLVREAEEHCRAGRHNSGLVLLALARLKQPGPAADRLWRTTLARLGKTHVRFVFLFHRFLGHLVLNTELFLRNQQRDVYGADVHHVVLAGSRPANRQMLEMYRRAIDVVESDRWYYLLHEVLPVEQRQRITVENAEFDQYRGTRPTAAFTDEEEERGRRLLREMGVESDTAWFACVFGRDDFHGEVDNSYRNAAIHDFDLAIHEVVRRGGYVFRLGWGVRTPLGITHPRVIDYASTRRTDFMDIYLVAKARFVFGSAAGITNVTHAFDVPFVDTGAAPIGHAPFRPGELYIPKKLVDARTGVPMSVRHASQIRYLDLWSDETVRQMGYRYVDSTAEDIRDVVVEMMDRLDGTFEADPEYLDLLQRSYEARAHRNAHVKTPVGKAFLKRNRWLYE